MDEKPTEIDYGQMGYVVEEALFGRKDKHDGYNAFRRLMSSRSELLEQNASLQQRVEALLEANTILRDAVRQLAHGKYSGRDYANQVLADTAAQEQGEG